MVGCFRYGLVMLDLRTSRLMDSVFGVLWVSMFGNVVWAFTNKGFWVRGCFTGVDALVDPRKPAGLSFDLVILRSRLLR